MKRAKRMKGVVGRGLMIAVAALIAWLPVSAKVSLPVTTINGRPCFYYTPQSSSETVYGLSKRLGLTREEIVTYNPRVADGLRKNERLYFPVSDFSDRIDIDKAGSEAAVPEEPSNMMKPVHLNLQVIGSTTTAPAETRTPSATGETEQKGVEPYTIAVLQPFGLGDETQGRPGRLATDFYKGFLLAADTLSRYGKTVTITAIDLSGAPLAESLARPEVRDAAVIVAPESPDFIGKALEAGVKGHVINTLDFADTLYLTSPQVVQMNIMHKNMYRKAVDYLLSNLSGALPVIISNSEGRNDKEAFTGYLRERLKGEGRAFREIEYEGTLSTGDLEGLPAGGDYVIVPSAGSIGEFNRFSHALNSYRMTNPTTGLRLFGYPEWVTFRGDAQDMLHTLGATIYSRYNDDFMAFGARNLGDEFVRWYGEGMIESIPSRGLLGYDLGNMLIKNLRANLGEFKPGNPEEYRGLQSTFKLVPAGGGTKDGGYVNDALYIVKYLPVSGTDCVIL